MRLTFLSTAKLTHAILPFLQPGRWSKRWQEKPLSPKAQLERRYTNGALVLWDLHCPRAAEGSRSALIWSARMAPITCGSRKLDLRAPGYSTTRFSDPTHRLARLLRGAVISIAETPTSPEETWMSLKQGSGIRSGLATSEKRPLDDSAVEEFVL